MNPKISSEILRFLSEEDKEIFLSELIDAVNVSMENQNFNAAIECLEKWEDTVEMLSIPGIKERVWDQFEKLKARGCIH